MSNLTSTAVAARDAARRSDGKFGTQPHSEQDELALPPTMSDEDAADLLLKAEESARWATANWGSYGANQREDIAGDAVLAYLEAAARRKQGEPQVRSMGGYVHTVVRREAAQRLRGPLNSREVTALALLGRAQTQAQKDLGRGLKGSELDDLAEEVRLRIPSKNRPAPGYHRKFHTQPFEHGTEFDVSVDAPEAGARHDPFEPGSAGDRAFQLKQAGTKKDDMEARRQAFVAVAERAGAPQPIPAMLTQERAIVLRKSLADSGGVMSQVDAFRDVGEAAELFAPFGPDLSPKERSAIADMFEEHPNYANDLWSAAVQIATKYRRRAS